MLVLYFELRSQFTNPEKVLVQCVLPAGLAFSLLAPLIPEGNQFYEVMNKLMNTRLRLSKYFLTQERITLFGQQFHLADKDLCVCVDDLRGGCFCFVDDRLFLYHPESGKGEPAERAGDYAGISDCRNIGAVFVQYFF